LLEETVTSLIVLVSERGMFVHLVARRLKRLASGTPDK
jgi:hypothetical protein